MQSCMCIGCSVEEERAIGRRLGTDDPRGFFALAQRVTWGLSQPDIVEVDVDAAVEALLREHADSFAAHSIAAAALLGSAPSRADQQRARAEELAGDDPLAHSLLPDDAAWTGTAPAQTLHEVVPDRVWRIRRDFAAVGVPFFNASLATLVRIDDDDLALINPVSLDPGVQAQVEALGTVRWLLTQGPGHSRYIAGAVEAFPAATNWGITGHRLHPSAARVHFDGMLDEDPSALPGALQVLPIAGTRLPEALIVHRPTRLLVAQDLIAHNAGNPTRPFFSRLYSVAFGLVDRVGFHCCQVPLWSDLGALWRGIDRVLEADVERVTAAHWPVEPAEPKAFREALQWLRELSLLAHKALLARYFWAQPRFLRDLVRFSLRRRALSRRTRPATPAAGAAAQKRSPRAP